MNHYLIKIQAHRLNVPLILVLVMLLCAQRATAQVPPVLVKLGGGLLRSILIDAGRGALCDQYKVPLLCGAIIKERQRGGSSESNIELAKDAVRFTLKNFDLVKDTFSKLYKPALSQDQILSEALKLGIPRDVLLGLGPNAIILVTLRQALAQTKEEIIEAIHHSLKVRFKSAFSTLIKDQDEDE